MITQNSLHREIDSNDCSPFDSSPFVYRHDEFLETTNARERPDLILSLQAQLIRWDMAGFAVQFLLIGGSFINQHLTANDIDGVGFYQLDKESNRLSQRKPKSMLEIQDEGRSSGVDMKLVPIDHDPMLLLRAAIYFGNLFSGDRRLRKQLQKPKDVWLVDLRTNL